MKKIIGISMCMLLIALVLPTSIADVEPLTTSEEDVEINISAGHRGKDYGFTVTVNILNHKTVDVNVFVNITLDYIFQNGRDSTLEFNTTALPEIPCYSHFGTVKCYPDGIKFISVTAEHEDKIVTRNGLSIGNFVILFK